MSPAARRKPLASVQDVPAPLIDEVVEEMAELMDGTREARACEGLSFAFRVSDRRVRPARYEVQRGGRIVLTREGRSPATFTFTGESAVFDHVLMGRGSALGAIMGRRIHMHGSLLHIRGILRMMPAVHRAYARARATMMTRHGDEYEFRFD